MIDLTKPIVETAPLNAEQKKMVDEHMVRRTLVQRIIELENALRPFASEPLTTEPEHNRTRLFSFDDLDEKIRRARAALGES
jgi:hypothetical protein